MEPMLRMTPEDVQSVQELAHSPDSDIPMAYRKKPSVPFAGDAEAMRQAMLMNTAQKYPQLRSDPFEFDLYDPQTNAKMIQQNMLGDRDLTKNYVMPYVRSANNLPNYHSGVFQDDIAMHDYAAQHPNANLYALTARNFFGIGMPR